MKLFSANNEVNYGSYDEGLDWNIQNCRIYHNGKSLSGRKALALFSTSLRLNIFASTLQAEFEFLKNDSTLRIMLIGYDLLHDLYIEKTWALTNKQFSWEGSPEKYQIQGKSLGLNFDVHCDSSGALHVHFKHFDHYQLHFISHIHRSLRKPLRNVNPFDFDTWSFSEKHAMLECHNMQLVVDGNTYISPMQIQQLSGAAGRHPTTKVRQRGKGSDGQEQVQGEDWNLSYEWSGGYLPPQTKELRCQFWQQGRLLPGAEGANQVPRATIPKLKQPLQADSGLPELAGSLLMMGHDSCSSESAIWLDQKVRYRLPRIILCFARSEQEPSARGGRNSSLLPDLEWEIAAGNSLSLSFRPFGTSNVSKLVFPLSRIQRIYGFFHGRLLDQLGNVVPIQRALGFIDYREIHWRKKQ